MSEIKLRDLYSNSYRVRSSIQERAYLGILPYYLRSRNEEEIARDDDLLRKLILRDSVFDVLYHKLKKKGHPSDDLNGKSILNHNTSVWYYGKHTGISASKDFAGNLELADPSILVPDFIVVKKRETPDGDYSFPVSLNFITHLSSKDIMEEQIKKAKLSLEILKKNGNGLFQNPFINFFLPDLPSHVLPLIVEINNDRRIKFDYHEFTEATLEKLVQSIKKANLKIQLDKETPPRVVTSLDKIAHYAKVTFSEMEK